MQGGSLLVCSAAGGEQRAGTNLNPFLQEHGITVLPDCVPAGSAKPLQPTAAQQSAGQLQNPAQILGPTEALVQGGIAHPAVLTPAPADAAVRSAADSGVSTQHVSMPADGVSFVYPSGANLAVQPPAVTLLTSGSQAHPPHRPVCARRMALSLCLASALAYVVLKSLLSALDLGCNADVNGVILC